MTNPDKSHITIVADRSGSMASMRADAEGGINTFIKDQAALPGECSLYLVDFDTNMTDGYRVVYDGPIGDCPRYQLVPRGGTPLLDAIGRAIGETGQRLAALPEDERPGHVFFVVQTDGQENASREFTLRQVTDLIAQQENQWKWDFVFLATGPDAFDQAGMFHGTQMVNNVVRNDGKTVALAYASASTSIARSRGGESVAYAADVTNDTQEDVTP